MALTEEVLSFDVKDYAFTTSSITTSYVDVGKMESLSFAPINLSPMTEIGKNKVHDLLLIDNYGMRLIIEHKGPPPSYYYLPRQSSPMDPLSWSDPWSKPLVPTTKRFILYGKKSDDMVEYREG